MNEKQKLKLWLRMHVENENTVWKKEEGKYYTSGRGLGRLLRSIVGPRITDSNDALDEIRKLQAFGVITRVKDEYYFEDEWDGYYIPNPDWRLLPKEFDDEEDI